VSKIEPSTKIKDLNTLSKIITKIKKQGKKIVLCHGCFDLMHFGHIKHLQAAKKMGDVLVVTITPDCYIKRGPGRPVFNEKQRADSIAALDCADYVAINQWPTAEETLKTIRPDLYVKGSDFESVKSDATGRLDREASVVKSIGGKLIFTDEEIFSSTKLLKDHFDILPDKIKHFLSGFTQKFTLEDVLDAIEGLKKLKVLIIGEPIIDEYNFCHLFQRASKSTVVSSKFTHRETYPGGALCVANHIAGFVKEVGLIGLLGKQNTKEYFIRTRLKKNIKLFPCYRDDGSTIIKSRFLERVFNQKMFEICSLNEQPINPELEKDVIKLFNKMVGGYDMVISADFGHGFITNGIVNILCNNSPYLVVMAQSNSANLGYNLITKYSRADYVVLDHEEIRLACHDQHGNLEDMVKKIALQLKCPKINTTLGHEGSLYYSKGSLYRVPALAWKIVDTIGAGDAVLALTSPLTYLNVHPEIVAFVGNCAGSLAVQYLGNKETIQPSDMIKLIQSFMK